MLTKFSQKHFSLSLPNLKCKVSAHAQTAFFSTTDNLLSKLHRKIVIHFHFFNILTLYEVDTGNTPSLAISAVSVDWRCHQLDHMTLYQKVSGSYITQSTYDRSYDVIYCLLLSRATTGLCFNFIPYMEVYNHTPSPRPLQTMYVKRALSTKH